MTRNARTEQFRKEIQNEYLIYLKEYLLKENFIYPVKEEPYRDYCFCIKENKEKLLKSLDNKYYLFGFNKNRKMFKAYENPESEIILKKVTLFYCCYHLPVERKRKVI